MFKKNRLTEEEVTTAVQAKPSHVVGKIIFVNKERGYGFISSREIRFTRIFFHWSALVNTTKQFMELEKGMTVEFFPEPVEGKGIRALKVKVIPNVEDELV